MRKTRKQQQREIERLRAETDAPVKNGYKTGSWCNDCENGIFDNASYLSPRFICCGFEPCPNYSARYGGRYSARMEIVPDPTEDEKEKILAHMTEELAKKIAKKEVRFLKSSNGTWEALLNIRVR